MYKLKSSHALLLLTLIFFDGWIWHAVIARPHAAYSITFLDVGQGDSSLLAIGNVQMVTDFGPDNTVVDALARVIPREDRYIDLLVITHPDQDHFGGLNNLLSHYGAGAIIWNGRDRPRGESANWDVLKNTIAEKHIPLVMVGAGDRVRYGPSAIDILSPDPMLLGGAATNDSAIVSKVTTPDFTVLLAADIGETVEAYIAQIFDVRADILKVAHHGSKFSSGKGFLEAVSPRLAVIQSGAGNNYGHPSEEALDRITEFTTAAVVRNDESGTIVVTRGADGLRVGKER